MTERVRYTTAQLIEAGTLAIGDGYRAKNSELASVGLPFARAGNIDSGFNFNGADHFPEVNLGKVREKVSRPGDVVFTSKGTVGRFGFVTERTPRFVYSPQLCYWRSLQPRKLHPRFLYYWMHGTEFWEQANGLKGQTDMADYVSLGDQRRMQITLPSPAEQEAVAEVLGSLDDKIELNRRMNRTLEATAAAIFKSWFVDFEPVVAKAAGRELYGMDAETAALFPNDFYDSPLGLIPEGWRAVPLPDAVQINPRRTLRQGETASYLDMANMPTQGHSPGEWTQRVFGSGMRFRNGDTLVARITPCLENGKTAFVDFLDEGQIGWGSTEFIVLRPYPPFPPVFGYLLARSTGFRDFAIQAMTGSSGRQRVPVEAMSKLFIPLPPPEIGEAFGRVVEPLFAEAKANVSESRTLAQLRDTLLPKLLSGDVRVKQAERALAAV